ncbi:MAG: glycosyltransferase [Candidatus Micrarchaeota archaeon]|nr:glycosyltransferase [Candidatus Micrarchaeota archaeon]
MRICIVIPAYNEERRIGGTLKEYAGALLKKYDGSVDLLVVSESTDDTDKIVKRFSKANDHIRLLSSGRRLNKGGAIIRGFRHACNSGYGIIGFADADLALTSSQIIKMLDRLRKGSIDGVIASRYAKGSRIIGKQKLARYVASRAYNLMVRLLFGFRYSDTQCGYKFFMRRSLCRILGRLTLTDMSFDINLLYELKMQRSNVVEMPIEYRMAYEGSTLRVRRQLPQMLASTIGFRIERSPIGRMIQK